MTPLAQSKSAYECARGHRYVVADGIPILLRGDTSATHDVFAAARTTEGREAALAHHEALRSRGGFDDDVRAHLVGTCGRLYTNAELGRYPIPVLPSFIPRGGRFLEVGCHWGRWLFAALGTAGFDAVCGVDPSLPGILAASRVADHFGYRDELDLFVADGRYLPFEDETFDVVFSFSVLQHLSDEDMTGALKEMARVTRRGGAVVCQLANDWGLRQWLNRRRGVHQQGHFHMRYRRPRAAVELSERIVGPTTPSPDAFFTLNAQTADLDLLPLRSRAVVYASEAMAAAARRLPFLAQFADSYWIVATRS